jgi:undecaprenyl-diphosphatase
MPDWIIVLILGIVEGITEFLPISSTGHLLITEKWMGIHKSDVFNVVIQTGAVLAVIPLFSARFHQFIYKWKEAATQDYLKKIILAFVITGAGGLVVDKYMKLPEELLPVAIALFVGGVFFLGVEFWLRGKPSGDGITWNIAIAVGIGQLIAAAFPGASRSGTTIIISLIMGLSRPAATEFSFLVSIPTMLAAGAWKLQKVLRHAHGAEPVKEDWAMLILATVVAAVVSFIAVKWLLRYVQTHTFVAFGWYRILAGIVIFGFLMSHPEAAKEPGADKKAPAVQKSHAGFEFPNRARAVQMAIPPIRPG